MKPDDDKTLAVEWRAGTPDREGLHALYESLGWNDFLGLDADALRRAMEGSWLCLSAYLGGRLAATGRIVSDGVINAYLCGVGVVPEFQGRGLGSELVARLGAAAAEAGLHLQLMAEEGNVPYYEARGWSAFAVGMKKDRA